MNLLAVLLALPIVVCAPQRLGPTIQPAHYTSGSGACVFEVEPTDRFGAGPMHARLLRDHEEAWSADFPWTFEAAGVAEDGTVVGYRNFDSAKLGVLRIAILDPKGKLRAQHELKHTFAIVDGPSLPRAMGRVVIHDVDDRASFEVWTADQRSPRPSRSYKLSSGAFAGESVPKCPITIPKVSCECERDVRAIGTLEWTLSHWSTAVSDRRDVDISNRSGVVVLTDSAGQVVWSRTIVDEPPKERAATTKRVTRDTILGVGPENTFALWDPSNDQRVDYAVEKDGAGPRGWRVRELQRTTFPVEPPTTKIDTLALVKLATTELALGAIQGGEDLTRIVDARFDDLGRCVIRASASDSLYVFDSNGIGLFKCAVSATERSNDSSRGSFRSMADGSVWMTSRDSVLHFDTRGVRIGKPIPRKIEASRAAPPDIELDGVDPVASAMSAIVHRPDGRWLTNVRARAVLADGRKVLLETPEDDAATPMLHFYSDANAPLNSIALPEGVPCDSFSVSARWIVVAGHESNGILVSIADGNLIRFEASSTKSAGACVGQTPDGRVLLVLVGDRSEIVHFALP